MEPRGLSDVGRGGFPAWRDSLLAGSTGGRLCRGSCWALLVLLVASCCTTVAPEQVVAKVVDDWGGVALAPPKLADQEWAKDVLWEQSFDPDVGTEDRALKGCAKRVSLLRVGPVIELRGWRIFAVPWVMRRLEARTGAIVEGRGEEGEALRQFAERAENAPSCAMFSDRIIARGGWAVASELFSGTMIGLHAPTGRTWELKLETPDTQFGHPAIAGEYIYVGTGAAMRQPDGSSDVEVALYCVGLDGKRRWRTGVYYAHESETRARGYQDAPVVAGDLVVGQYFDERRGRHVTACYTASDGRLLWERTFTDEPFNPCVPADSRVLVLSLGSRLCRVAAGDGRTVWSREPFGGEPVKTLRVSGARVYAVNGSCMLVMDVATGRTLGRVDLGYPITDFMVVDTTIICLSEEPSEPGQKQAPPGTRTLRVEAFVPRGPS